MYLLISFPCKSDCFQQVLTDEAARLEKGEVAPSRKTKDKNALLDSEMSTWMLSTLQKGQIAKTSGGGALLAAGGLSNPQHHGKTMTVSPAVMDFAKSLSNTHELTGSPQKMLPFQDFYALFQSHTQKTNDTAAAGADATAPAVDNTAAKSDATEETRKRTASSSSSVVASSTGKASDEGSVHRTASQQDVTVNIVKHLSEQDPHFDAYLQQVAQRDGDHPASQRAAKMNSMLTKPRRMRKVALLGTFSAGSDLVSE